MGLQNERLLQQLLTQDHRKPLADLLELARMFEAAKCKTVKQGDADRSEGMVAVSNVRQQGQSKQRKPEVHPTTLRGELSIHPRLWPATATKVRQLWKQTFSQ